MLVLPAQRDITAEQRPHMMVVLAPSTMCPQHPVLGQRVPSLLCESTADIFPIRQLDRAAQDKFLEREEGKGRERKENRIKNEMMDNIKGIDLGFIQRSKKAENK